MTGRADKKRLRRQTASADSAGPAESPPIGPPVVLSPARRLAEAACPPILIVALCLLAYGGTLRYPFYFDDLPAITQNAVVTRGLPVTDGEHRIRRYWPDLQAGLIVLTLRMNYRLGGDDPLGYHLFNLAVHVLAALTLYGIVRRTLLTERPAERFGRHARWLALAAALLWALHPMQPESVTYVVQRKESLTSLLFLLTLYFFIRGATAVRRPGEIRTDAANSRPIPAKSPGTSRTARIPRPLPWYGLAVASCLAGMAGKAMIATLPIVVLLYDAAFLAGSPWRAVRRRWPVHLLLAASWAVLLAAFRQRIAGEGLGTETFPWWHYVRMQFLAILYYLRQAVWPVALNFDPHWPIEWFDQCPLQLVLLPAAGLALLTAATVWALLRRPAWGFWAAWVLLIVAPSSSVFVIVTLRVSEHRMYLPLAGLAVLAVMAGYAGFQWAGRRVARPPDAPRQPAVWTPGLAAALAVAALLLLTFDRNRDYRSEVAIWQDTAAKSPWSDRAQGNYGAALAGQARSLTGDGRAQALRRAIPALERAVAINPRNNAAWVSLASAHERRGELAQALDCYNRALAVPANRDQAALYVGRAHAYLKLGRPADAQADCDRAIDLDAEALGAYLCRAEAAARLGHFDQAIRDAQAALAIEPDCAGAYAAMGYACARIGDFTRAFEHLDRAVRLDPDASDFWYKRGFVRNLAGDHLRSRGQPDAAQDSYRRALTDLSEAVRLSPGLAESYFQRGQTFGRLDRLDEAIADFTMVIELTPAHADAYRKRALAWFQKNQPDKGQADMETYNSLRSDGPPDGSDADSP